MLLTYQPADASDLDALFAFNKELIDQYEDLSQIPYQKVLAWVRQKLEQQIQEYTCILADGQKAGYYHFSPMDSDTMELDDLYLFPAFRGHGIGTAVIQKCCAETSQPIMLYVFQKNTGAIALYQRMGFQIQCTTQNVSSTRYIMRRG
ncbi:GNAT family N-acetyltransferase [Faecalibacterium sp. An192]|uniref:GNAT family N-acetyltransferase n=1 Tax=Faecalibacterium sp. An192 TaxID=1965581 RepID=UPI000B367378|nr:GNAT family N-acetyltransferase [Faecalibacterium sp. An192]OUP26372.1 GNAT family N-acetyltransferase [Faecalibacterium sp. An192]